ncbi:hypothetical protein HWI79_1531 [Cryptosporidium felis]|nr:hypothetical protein HWI79_1531 [Cryptosporidium felis]
MRTKNLFFLIFAVVVLGLGGLVIADSNDEGNNSGSGVGSLGGKKKRLGLPWKFSTQNIFKKGSEDEPSIDLLTSRLLDLELRRRETKNPFKKLRCYIQELKIKRKLRALLKEKEEEEKLGKFEEEIPVDYSPDASSDEGSVQTYTPITVESFEDTSISDSLSKMKTIEPFDEEPTETSSKDKNIDLEEEEEKSMGEVSIGTDEDLKDETEDKVTGSEDDLGNIDEDEAPVEGSEKIENAIDEESKQISQKMVEVQGEDDESTKEQKKDLSSNEGRKRLGRRFREMFKRRKDRSSKLERLLKLRSEFTQRLGSTKSRLMRRYLQFRLRRVESKISKLTAETIDEVDILDTQ